MSQHRGNKTAKLRFCALALALGLVACLPFAAYADEGQAGSWDGSAASSAASSASSASSAASTSSSSSSSSASSAASSVDSDAENVVNPAQRTDSSFIYDTGISALNDTPSLYDGQTVQVMGEAIGDRIVDDSDSAYCWVELSSEDDHSTVSVHMTVEQAGLIDTFGRYGYVGSTLQVRGTYHQVCDEHEGVSDLHATSVELVEKGRVDEKPVSFSDFLPGIVLVCIGAALTGVFYYVREKQR